MSYEPKAKPEVQHIDDIGLDHTGKAHDVAHQKEASTKYADLGADWLNEYNGPEIDLTDEDSNRVRWKIDRHIIPLISVIYFCQQLDKSTLSFASVFGITQDAHLKGQQYSWLSSIVYFAQLVFQPLSVYALVKFPVNYWICFCFFCWGASVSIMSAMRSFAGIAVFRFIMGAFEASIAPSMLVVVAMWWTRREQPLRNNIWYSCNGLALILGSLISYGLGHANDSHLKHYQIIFLVCGLISVGCAIPVTLLFPGHPTTARFLTNEDKYLALQRIRLNQTGTQTTHFKWSQVIECFTDPKQWIFMIMVFCISLVSGGIGSFGPLILKGFGLSTFKTILYNMIPGAISIVTNIVTAYLVMISKRKSPILFVASLFPLAAAVGLYKLPRTGTHTNNQSLLAVYFILQVYQCITPIIFTWAFANTAGHTKKTTTTGMLYIGLTVGNIVGPQLYKSKEAPRYSTGLEANLAVLCILTGLIVVQTLYLGFLNKRNVSRRRENGKTGAVVDYSLESSNKWQGLREEQAKKDAAEGHVEEHNTQAFLDLTDMQNEDFVYSL